MTDHTSTMSSLSLPTLADLDPIANFIAMRFALAGVSANKVFQVLEVLHYHCLQMEGYPPRPAFELSKLISWLDKFSKEFRDTDAQNVLQVVLQWYDQTARRHGDPPARLQIKRSLSDLMAVMTWKYKSFEIDDRGCFQRPWVLGLAAGDQKVGLYHREDRQGKPLYTTIQLKAESAQSLQKCYQALQPVNKTIMQMRSLDQAGAIRQQLDTAIGNLNIGWRARLAVGIQIVKLL